jgi:hypothetical protein
LDIKPEIRAIPGKKEFRNQDKAKMKPEKFYFVKKQATFAANFVCFPWKHRRLGVRACRLA